MTDEQLEKIFNGTPGIGHERLFNAMRAAMAVEREGCAKVCEAGFGGDAALVGRRCAEKIRMRSNVKVTGDAPPFGAASS